MQKPASVVAEAPQSQPRSWLARMVGILLARQRPEESDIRFGVRLALYGPVAFYLLLTLALVLFHVEGEAGVGIFYSYWLFIGASQCVYLIPGILLAVVARRRGVAWGLLRGGGIIAGLNALAWLVGYYGIGAR